MGCHTTGMVPSSAGCPFVGHQEGLLLHSPGTGVVCCSAVKWGHTIRGQSCREKDSPQAGLARPCSGRLSRSRSIRQPLQRQVQGKQSCPPCPVCSGAMVFIISYGKSPAQSLLFISCHTTACRNTNCQHKVTKRRYQSRVRKRQGGRWRRTVKQRDACLM